ncbi:hypothetical protein [Clostridium perfringens]|nr:hypothetical protein [Clostridium perfringens]
MANSEVKYPYWILTINYVIFIYTIKNNIVYKAPGIIVLNIVMFIKYVIMPLTFCMSNELLIYAKNYDHMLGAFIILLYEQIGIFITIYLTGKKEKKKFYNNNSDIIFYDLKYGPIIAIVFIGLLILLAVKYRYLLGGIGLITKGALDISNENIESVSGAVGILWQASIAWLYMYINFKIKERNSKRNTPKIFWVIVTALIYILITFIGQTSISRWYTIISFCAVYFTLLKLYPKKSKEISIIIFVPFFLLMLIVSVFKNTSYLSGGMNFKDSILEMINPGSLDAYFSGPVSVNNALGLWIDTKVNIFSAPIDILNNMPIVNHWIDNSNGSINLYNAYIGRLWNGSGDQIIPLVGQSIVYFSPLFAPLLSILMVKLVRYFDRRYIKSNTLSIYLYAFAGAWIGVSIILNLTIMMSWVYIRIIPLFLIIKMTEYMGIRRLEKN